LIKHKQFVPRSNFKWTPN